LEGHQLQPAAMRSTKVTFVHVFREEVDALAANIALQKQSQGRLQNQIESGWHEKLIIEIFRVFERGLTEECPW
jgi:hypothetical protein